MEFFDAVSFNPRDLNIYVGYLTWENTKKVLKIKDRYFLEKKQQENPPCKQ